MASTTVLLIPTPPQAARSAGLPAIDFSDCYHGHTERAGVTAMEAARAMFERPPAWVNALMAARDAAVSRLGLKTSQDATKAAKGRHSGIFPVLTEMPNEVVLGLDDKHLDFRIWVSVQAVDGGSDISTATLVRLHGWPGRIYLSLILPFHKLLSRHRLKRALRELNRSTG